MSSSPTSYDGEKSKEVFGTDAVEASTTVAPGAEIITPAPSMKEVDHSDAEAQPVDTLSPAAHVPPDGGLHAWLKVFGGFLIYMNIWGFTLVPCPLMRSLLLRHLHPSSPMALSKITIKRTFSRPRRPAPSHGSGRCRLGC